MKKLALLTTILLIIICSCNKVDTSEGIFKIIGPVEVSPWDPEYARTVVQKIYVEEFTGHTCTNCPDGARRLKAIMDEDPNIVATAIHCTNFANPITILPNNYKTPMGDIIHEKFNIRDIPKAIINRIEISSNEWGIDRTRWRSVIEGIDRNNVRAGIQLKCTVDEINQEIEVHVAVTIIKEIPNPVQICLVLQQDSIISGQLDGSANNLVPDYVHMHMLRAGFNGNYGTRLTPNGIVAAQHKYSTTFKLSYGNSFPYSHIPVVIKNCSVVAYLIDMVTNEVLQVEYVYLD